MLLPMTTTEPSQTTQPSLEQSNLDDLPGVRGPIITRDHPDYDRARAVYNAAVDRYPLAIVRCADVADVLACVEYARDRVLPLAIRGGAHHGGGFGVWNDALVIDLGGLRSTTVDPAAGTVRVDAGCTWGDVDHATGAFGMATPSGFVSTTGVAGLALGGGVGYLTRQFGMTVDNLVSADVVLADGRFVTASADSHPDLFWALRGGGGNFGVVTSFTFRCHPVGEHGVIIGGPVMYDLADIDDMFRWYRELLPTLPENLNGWIGITIVPPAAPFPEHLWSRTVGVIMWCYTGPHADADVALAEIRDHGEPLLVGLAPMPFSMLQTAFDGLLPSGLQWHWKADFYTEITDQAISVHRRYADTIPTPLSTMHMYPISGAAARVAQDATAFAYRDGGWAGVIAGIDADSANLPAASQWAQDYWRELHDSSAGGGYVNMMMEDEGPDRVRSAYRGNYDRLVSVKQRYDPTNLFHINHNITPARSGFDAVDPAR